MDQLHVSPSLTEVITSTEHYSIQREIGRGGTAYCHHAQARHDNDYWVVLKEFAPHDLRPFLQRQTHNGPLVLTESWLQEEYDSQKRYFLDEVTRCKEINDSDGNTESNVPYILRAHYVPERDDLLCIDTEKGWTIYDYVKKHRPKGQLTTEYIAVCLEIISRLMDGLKHIHKTHLHLDITPKNIYIVTTKTPLNAWATYSVKLFDFASARRKEEFSIENIDTLRAQYPCSTYTQGYTHYSLRDFWTELEYDPSAAKAHVAERPIDERVDLFSVGAVLLYMLTGNSQTVVDGNIDAIQYIGVKDIKNNTLLQLLQELIAGAMMSSDRYMDTAKCDENFSSDLRDIQHGFQNAAGFSAIQVLAICGGKTFADTPQTELMGRLRISNETATNLTSYILAQGNGMCLSVTAEQGGAGKTSQMQHLYQTLLRTDLNAIPLLVPLGQLSKGKSPLTQYICQKYCGSNEANEPALIQLLNDHSHRWYLLLDAMDELENGISVGKELRTFVERCPNLVIVVTSRYKSFHLPENTIEAEILPLERTQASLQFPDASDRMLDVLSLPMLFRIAVEVQHAEYSQTIVKHNIYGSNKFYRVNSEGELLEAYVSCQISKSRLDGNASSARRSLWELLPQIAWDNRRYGKPLRRLKSSEEKDAATIAAKYGFLTIDEETDTIQFSHERWHRFFRAYYLYQMLCDIANTEVGDPLDENAWELMKNEYFPEEICSLLGDLARDYLRVPTQDSEGYWHKSAKDEPSPVDLAIEHLRGKQNVGYACANIVNIMRFARKDDLSLANFSELDLRNTNLRGVTFAHANHADFRNAHIARDTFCSPQLEDCMAFAIWNHYFISVSESSKGSKLHVTTYDMHGWQWCSEISVLTQSMPQQIIRIPCPLEDNTTSIKQLSVSEPYYSLTCSLQVLDMHSNFAKLCLLTPKGLLHYISVDAQGGLALLSEDTLPSSFTFGDLTYLLPQNGGPQWTSYRDDFHKKNYIIQWMLSDKKKFSGDPPCQILRSLYAWNEKEAELIEIPLPYIGLIKDVTVLIGNAGDLRFLFTCTDGTSLCYTMNRNLLTSVETEGKEYLHLSHKSWIDRIVCKNGKPHYLLCGHEVAAINSKTLVLSGCLQIKTTNAYYCDPLQCVFGCVNHSNPLITRSCVVHYDSPIAEAQYFDGRIVAVSPDKRYALLAWQQGNLVQLKLFELQTRMEITCLLENTSIGVQACWTKNHCVIRDSHGMYRFSISSDLSTHLYTITRFVSAQPWIFETKDEDVIEKYTYWSGLNKFQYEMMSSYDIFDWLDAKYEKYFLSLEEMSERFADTPSSKPRFLNISGCDMRGIRMANVDSSVLREILRYNGAIVDDE